MAEQQGGGGDGMGWVRDEGVVSDGLQGQAGLEIYSSSSVGFRPASTLTAEGSGLRGIVE